MKKRFRTLFQPKAKLLPSVSIGMPAYVAKRSHRKCKVLVALTKKTLHFEQIKKYFIV